jgi:hypothetical protein
MRQLFDRARRRRTDAGTTARGADGEARPDTRPQFDLAVPLPIRGLNRPVPRRQPPGQRGPGWWWW